MSSILLTKLGTTTPENIKEILKERKHVSPESELSEDTIHRLRQKLGTNI